MEHFQLFSNIVSWVDIFCQLQGAIEVPVQPIENLTFFNAYLVFTVEVFFQEM